MEDKEGRSRRQGGVKGLKGGRSEDYKGRGGRLEGKEWKTRRGGVED